jgi:hypothetical protein
MINISSGYEKSPNLSNVMIILAMLSALASVSCSEDSSTNPESDTLLGDASDMNSGEVTEDGTVPDEQDQPPSDATTGDTVDGSETDLSDGNTADNSDGLADAVIDITESDIPPGDSSATPDSSTEDTTTSDLPVSDTSVEDSTVEITPDTTGGDTEDAGETDLSALPTFDCATITDDVVPVTVVPGPRANRGLTFNLEGDLLIGVMEPNIIQSPYGGPMTSLANIGGMEQIDLLPDGDYVVANYEDKTLMRVTPAGSTNIIVADVPTYVVRVGPDGMVYATNGEEGSSSRVFRIDPDTGEKLVILRGSDAATPFGPRVLDFSPDLAHMYFGTYQSEVYVVDLDDDLNPVGAPTILARDVGGWHDGLGVDICGYIYIASYNDQDAYRISPDGSEVIKILNSNSSEGMYGHGIAWGSGVGGWQEDALYMPQPNNGGTVGEALIGVPYRTWEGIVLNRP